MSRRYREYVPDLAAVTDRKDQNPVDLRLTVEDHQNIYFVYGYLTAVADYKDIQSLTHFEDSVEDSRTADLAWLTQDQD